MNTHQSTNLLTRSSSRSTEKPMYTKPTKPLFALVFVFALIGALLAPLAYAAGESTSFTATLQKYEPTPVQPGEVVEAWIQVTNTGRTPSSIATLTIDTTYPFTPTSASDRSVVLGSIGAGSSYLARVRLAVDAAAADGVYTLPVQISTDAASSSTIDLSIQVRSSNAVLDVASAKTTPTELVPGTPADFAVVVRNTQASVLRDVSLELDLADTTLSTLGTTTKQTVSRIDGTSDATFRFRLVADPEAQSGVVRVPLTFSFTTTDGTAIEQTETTGVLVHAAPDISVLVDRVTRSADGNEATVLVRVVNKGLSQIKFAEIIAQNGDGYTLGSGRRAAYVGNIDSDDFQTAEFTIVPTQDDAAFRGTLTYSDALNTPVSMPVEAQFSLPPKANGRSSTWIVIVVIVLVVGGIILWRRSKPKKDRR